MAEIKVDEEFDKIVQTDLKISDAFILLGYKTREMNPERRKEAFAKKANQ